MLTRKPYVGETLDYDSAPAGGKKTGTYRVSGFGDRAGQEEIMRMVNVETGTEVPIIWKFSDGLNKCLSHKKDSVDAEAAAPAP